MSRSRSLCTTDGCRLIPLPAWMTVLLLALPVSGMDLKDLHAMPDLTPKKFMGLFKDFDFKFHGRLQEPNEFLLTRSGDCDDFAVVADLALNPHGYDTRLVGVRMPGLAHMVCYVINDKVYLDYNNRLYFMNLPKSEASLRSVAAKVAKSLKANWTTASEYVYTGRGQIQAVATVVKTEPESSDPPFGKRQEGIRVDF